MTLKSYIWGIRLVALFSFISFGLALNYIDPEKSGFAGQTVFFLVLFFLFSSSLNLALLWIRKKILGAESVAINIGLSFRQSILLSFFIIGLLVLQSMRVLIWWDGLLLLAAIFIIELYFLNR